jgi:hypothetical protein
VELRHLVPAFDAGRLRREPGLQALFGSDWILVAAVLQPDLAKLGREPRAFAEERVAVETGPAFPNALAMLGLGADRIRLLDDPRLHVAVADESAKTTKKKTEPP